MLKLQYWGHSAFSLADGEYNLLIDPFISGNPLAVNRPGDLNPTHILLTHGHSDHLGDALSIAKKNGSLVIAPTELANYCGSKGAKAHAMYMGTAEFQFGKLRMTPAWHGSSAEEKGKTVYLGTPCGYVIYLGGKCIYHAGDTGLFGDMALIGRMNPLDCALLPIGGNFTMDPEEALEAALMLAADLVIPMHFDTFPLIKQDAADYVKHVRQKGLKALALAPGDILEL